MADKTTGKKRQKGSSIEDLPKKQEVTLYIFALDSLRKTPLSAGNVNKTVNELEMKTEILKKKRHPLRS